MCWSPYFSPWPHNAPPSFFILESALPCNPQFNIIYWLWIHTKIARVPQPNQGRLKCVSSECTMTKLLRILNMTYSILFRCIIFQCYGQNGRQQNADTVEFFYYVTSWHWIQSFAISQGWGTCVSFEC